MRPPNIGGRNHDGSVRAFGRRCTREAPRWDPEVIEGGTAIAPAARALERPSQSPEPKPEDGAQLLNDIKAAIKRFVWLPEERYYDLLAVWVLYTHTYDLFDHSPRLAIWSPTKGSGKSTLLSVLRFLVRKGKIRVSPTPAGLFRRMNAEHPTLLLDELDKHVTRSGYLDRLLWEVLNAGHMRGAEIDRFNLDKDAMSTFDPFGPIAFAYKNVTLPEDLMDRSLLIKLRPAKGRGYKPFNTRHHSSELQAIEKRARAWAKQEREALDAAHPEIPTGIVDRRRSNWHPLLAVADAAGGDWAERIRQVALFMEGQRKPDGELSILANAKTVWDNRPSADFLRTEDLVEELNKPDEWPWGAWNDGQRLNARTLARLLEPFGVAPKRARPNKRLVRGYSRPDFEKAWRDFGLIDEVTNARRKKAA